MPAEPPSDTPQLTLFLSYARPDRPRIEQLSTALATGGYRLWWDALIEGGEAFAKSIESALDMADVVLVAWSANSVASDWVRDEAAHGRDRGRLVPISLDGSQPPLGFRQYHFIDFSRWNGKAASIEIDQLVTAIAKAAHAPLPEHTTGQAQRYRPPMMQRRGVVIGAGVAGLAVAAGGWWGWQRLYAPADSSIAVLPFANLSGDPGQAYFADGLSEEIRARLGSGGNFQVAAQTSSEMFRDQKADIATIAGKLGVAHLLEGSVRRAGDQLRIAAQLIEARSGLSKWSQSFDRTINDVFAVQKEIATSVAQAIAGTMVGALALPGNAETSNPAALDAYLKGRALYNLDIDESTDRQALALFDSAIALDPKYALAYTARAQTIMDIAALYSTVGDLPQLYADALRTARKAADLSPNLAEAQLALGNVTYISQLNFRAARTYYDKALNLGRSNATILELCAYFASKSGRNAEALTAIDKALVLDRLNPLMYRAKGNMLLAARRFDEAIVWQNKALSLNPKLSSSWMAIGTANLMLGRMEQAAQAFAKEPNEAHRLTGMAISKARTHDIAGAKTLLAQLVAKKGDFDLYQQGQILAQIGETDSSLGRLERALALKDSGITLMYTDPLLDPLRHNARFDRLLSQIGLP